MVGKNSVLLFTIFTENAFMKAFLYNRENGMYEIKKFPMFNKLLTFII